MMPGPIPATLPYVGGIEDIEFPSVSRATVIGISVAVAGNVLISLALNLQKLAHARLEKARAERDHGLEDIEEEEDSADAGGALGVSIQHDQGPPSEVEREAHVWNGNPESRPQGPSIETDPLITFPRAANAELLPMSPTYGALSGTDDAYLRGSPLQWKRKPTKGPVAGDAAKYANGESRRGSKNEGQESEYLRSKLWWLGFLLMNVGETGNFISYAFAPASVVAPLGTFALIANCLFAPLLLHERLRKRDVVGIMFAIVGAVTVVLSSNASDAPLTLEKLLEAISQRIFLVFSVVYAIGMFVLMGLSEGSAGRRWVLVDVGLCALFGGFTVLSTKAISTLLATRGFDMFKETMTYPVLAVLFGTGVGQIRYLNRALMRFDSKVVIPTQFVLFNLSAILGSAILYGDFRTAKFHQFVTFMYGCAATFAGVWVIAWEPASNEPTPGSNDVEGAISGGEGDGHNLLLVDGTPTAGVGRRQAGATLRTRRSTVSLVGISPAQRLLLLHTPPRPEIPLGQEYGALEAEHSGRGHDGLEGSIGRRRAIGWLSDGSPTRQLGGRRRERGSVERRLEVVAID
ncbi:DUF803-domain-containing protein [Lactarius hengduanensis]|nr:DUF803-domain-containing protein [Lactarius hengduanensis]